MLGNLRCKYAGDTYLIVPSSNIDIRFQKLSNVEAGSRVNNIELNQAKSVEVIFTENK